MVLLVVLLSYLLQLVILDCSGRRAPYTGTADGIGLGDGKKGRSMQPIKKRSGMSLAKKALMMTPMGLGFMAGKKLFQGAKGLAGKAAGSGLGKGLKGLWQSIWSDTYGHGIQCK